MAKTFTVVYRTGGTENFRWNRTLAYQTKAEAMTAAAETRRMGYKAMVFETKALDAVGMPETYEPGDPLPGEELLTFRDFPDHAGLHDYEDEEGEDLTNAYQHVKDFYGREPRAVAYDLMRGMGGF